MFEIIRRMAVLTVTTLLATACATTNVQRAWDLSLAGVSSAQSTAAVVDIAIDSSIDSDSKSKVRATKPSALEPAAPDERKKRLEDSDKQLIITVVRYTELRSSLGALEAYFLALQALADGSQADATGAAVEALATRINSLNGTLSKRVVLSEAQAKALTGFTKLVATQVHGAIVADALKRDAETIGRAILLQQLVLEESASEIAAGIREENQRLWTDKVLTPYQQGNVDAEWVENRRAYIKIAALGDSLQEVKNAQAAAARMQATWKKILSGELSAADLAASLKETDELLAAVAALKAAERPKKSQ
jgi:hypothetical protein